MRWHRAAEENFNVEKNSGLRAALKVDLDENWTATAKVMHQSQKSTGVWDHDPDRVGDLQVERFFPDQGKDKFTQFAGTISGNVISKTTRIGRQPRSIAASSSD